ncbi:MAG TPA: hypothetical protein VFZ78_10795 [Flavisolibacter sp.]
MAQSTPQKKQANNNVKQRVGDTSRTSSQGRKQASGGDRNTNNQGRPRGGTKRDR